MKTSEDKDEPVSRADAAAPIASAAPTKLSQPVLDHPFAPLSIAPAPLASSVVAARTLVAGIDLRSPLLTPGNVGLLRALSDKYESYIRQGRGREAHAMAAAMQIAWRMFSEPDIPLELPDTAHGSLD